MRRDKCVGEGRKPSENNSLQMMLPTWTIRCVSRCSRAAIAAAAPRAWGPAAVTTLLSTVFQIWMPAFCKQCVAWGGIL